MVFKLFIGGLFIIVGFACNVSRQPADGGFRPSNFQFTLQNDMLVSDKGDSIYIGKRLIIGKGSGEKGRYQAITFKSAAAFPLVFLRNAEIKNDPEYQADPSARDDDKVKEYLTPGQSLIVKKISSKGDNKAWHYYQVLLGDGGTKFICDIGYALELKELLVQ